LDRSRLDGGKLWGGGSLISGTDETLTERPPAIDLEDLRDSPAPDIQPPASNGSAANGSSANGASHANRSLVGQTVDGTISGITHFGAFVNLEGGQTGLIHISEIAHEYVRDIRDHLKLKEPVRVKVLQVNPANGKYDLSLKQTREAPAAVPPKGRSGKREKVLAEGADPVFEEKLSKFLKSSEERLLDLKRNLEEKRGRPFK
jgi:S1 RNA binding domain protein